MYENELLLFRLEQAEQNDLLRREIKLLQNNVKCDNNEEVIRMQMKLKSKEEEWPRQAKECKQKITKVEMALNVKIK